MRIKKVELSFTREELQKSIEYQEPDNEFFSCGGISHFGDGLSCDDCPLEKMSPREGLEYIRNHLEDEEKNKDED